MRIGSSMHAQVCSPGLQAADCQVWAAGEPRTVNVAHGGELHLQAVQPVAHCRYNRCYCILNQLAVGGRPVSGPPSTLVLHLLFLRLGAQPPGPPLWSPMLLMMHLLGRLGSSLLAPVRPSGHRHERCGPG